MRVTFITTVKVLLRDRSVLMWAVAFPLILSTLFYAMFSNLDEAYQLDPIAVVVVEDENYTQAENFVDMVVSLASNDANDGSPLIKPTYVSSEQRALKALEEGSYYGYIMVNSDQEPVYHRDARHVDSLGDPSQTILINVLDRYVQNTDLITTILEDNPGLLRDPTFLSRLTDDAPASYTERISVTENPPSDSQRYYFAVLAFSTIMMATFALVAIDGILGNTSALGARRSVGGQSKVRTVLPTMAAAWLLSFICVLIGFFYLRFLLGISFGGKEAAVVLTLAMSTLCSTFLGGFLGSLPVQSGVKSGLVAFLSCFLSLFAGLYGAFSQDIGDMVARDLPWLSACNPVRQVTEAFYSLYYYSGYEHLLNCLASLAVFSIVFFIASILIIRRQRYASL